ncbi:hypothetical protein [Natrialba taiwanensis]|uniref:Uncharacterized protein n=1 Tax=Natrialba taiwanensis DSM 12281 TaxID=1230458 RepID=L9ZGR7_9EURY|nr:hypothetical protein [Natrialba taiwanensis]ELY85675.1 hypothetical protein C484_20192 [Natrialba taiwanensis DSM 12281]
MSSLARFSNRLGLPIGIKTDPDPDQNWLEPIGTDPITNTLAFVIASSESTRQDDLVAMRFD